MLVRLSILVLLGAPIVTFAQKDQQPAPFNITQKVKAITEKCDAAKSYLFQGDLEVGTQPGEGPFTLVRRAKFTIASAEDGKSRYEMRIEGQDEYQIVSNGQKTWNVLPGKKQYTEEESAATKEADDDEEQSGEEDGDIADHYVRLVMPALKDLLKSTRAAGYYGEAALKINGSKGKWPVLRLGLQPKENGGQRVMELVFDSESLAVGRMTYATVNEHNGQRTAMRATLRFERFEIGGVPNDLFAYDPPKNAKLVESLILPGYGGVQLGHAAPDFELKAISGDKVKLSELRGQPVMLNFWASWCPPCRQELPVIEKLSGEYKSKGLRVFGVNDEGKSAAKHYMEKADLTFPTLDDNSQKVNRLYGVRSIPRVFLIDRDGNVVKLLTGGHEEAALREALKSVGL